jgi:hypothetical protein
MPNGIGLVSEGEELCDETESLTEPKKDASVSFFVFWK